MKMPQRRYFPMDLPPDMFGLRPLTLLGEALLTEGERRERLANVEERVVETFNAAVRQLGEDGARKLFRRVTRKPKRGAAKVLAADRDYQLLLAYDNRPCGETVTALARRLHAGGIALGSSPEAIARQVFRIVAARKERQHKAAVEARYSRMALRRELPTLLEMARTAK